MEVNIHSIYVSLCNFASSQLTCTTGILLSTKTACAPIIAALDTTYFCIVWKEYNEDSSCYNTFANVCQYTTSTLSCATASKKLNSDSTTSYPSAIAALDSTHFGVLWEESSDSTTYNIFTKLYLISGTSFSLVTTSTILNTATTSDATLIVLDSTHFSAIRLEAGVKISSCIYGSSLDCTTIVQLSTNSNAANPLSVALDATHLGVAWEEQDGATYTIYANLCELTDSGSQFNCLTTPTTLVTGTSSISFSTSSSALSGLSATQFYVLWTESSTSESSTKQ